jgi:hypothetical protein
LIASSSTSADAVAVARVDDRDALARDAGDHRPEQRVVGAAQQERVDPRRRRQGEDELAGLVTRPEQRRERVPDDPFDVRAGQLPGLDERHERRRRVLVDLDRRGSRP